MLFQNTFSLVNKPNRFKQSIKENKRINYFFFLFILMFSLDREFIMPYQRYVSPILLSAINWNQICMNWHLSNLLVRICLEFAFILWLIYMWLAWLIKFQSYNSSLFLIIIKCFPPSASALITFLILCLFPPLPWLYSSLLFKYGSLLSYRWIDLGLDLLSDFFLYIYSSTPGLCS